MTSSKNRSQENQPNMSDLETIITFHKNGNVQLKYTSLYGKRHGLSQLYHENGKLRSEANYLNDIREGESKEWFENGTIHLHEFYVNGKKHGESKEWYPKHKNTYIHEHYLNGKRNGTRTLYEYDRLCKEEEYINGMIVKYKWISYFPNGNIKQLETFENGKDRTVSFSESYYKPQDEEDYEEDMTDAYYRALVY